ncbi:hypothetical protein [Metabacillus idriensis]|uniref:hypothetical protein n=1 Tax=Metabacillus idriensis TaxID=324768 RepID=UPI003D2713F7
MINNFILWTVLIAPWLTLFLIKKEKIKRFMPAAIFASYLMIIYNVIANNQNHWILNDPLIHWLEPLFVSGVFGAFPVITLWVFYFTYGKFLVYLTVNIVIDFMFSVFPIHYIFQEVFGIYKLVNITPWERFFLFVLFSIVLYGYQKWQDEVFTSKLKNSSW